MTELSHRLAKQYAGLGDLIAGPVGVVLDDIDVIAEFPVRTVVDRIRSVGVTGPGQPEGVRLLLVRHGEAHCNVRATPGVDGCAGLTPRGHCQAAAVAAALAVEQHEVAVVYTSSAVRAVQTARPIADAVGAPVVRALPYGPADADPRVGAHLDVLANRHHGQTVVLVCHNTAIQAAEQHLRAGSRTLDGPGLTVDYASITEWERCAVPMAGDRSWVWVRRRHNDLAHRAIDSAG